MADDDNDLRDETTIHGSFADISRHEEAEQATLLIHTTRGAQAIPLSAQHPVTIGRGRSADLTVQDRTLSREHVRFRLVDSQVWVEDLGSTNGTRVNGKPVQKQPLGPDDEVALGAVRVSIHLPRGSDGQLRALESHDRFHQRLQEEVHRARRRGRKVGLVMVRSSQPEAAHLGRWSAALWRLLEPFEHAALYSLDTIEILLPDTTLDHATGTAEAIAEAKIGEEPALLCGAAVFPDAASSVDELFQVTRFALQQATVDLPVGTTYPSQVQSGRIQAIVPDEAAGDEQPVVFGEALQAVFETAKRVARSQMPILIQGETGTGKEVLAREIHAASGRKGQLRCINCGAIPGELIESVLFGHEKGAFTGAAQRSSGVFESTDQGTLLLDEIGELPLPAQTALLRVLETKQITRVGGSREIKVDVRIVAATHRDLEAMCERGDFRSDLYYRLNVMTMRIPPLRERREEVQQFVKHFMAVANRENGCKITGIDPAAMAELVRYDWPGNVRELRNVVERAVVIAQESTITIDDLPDRLRSDGGRTIRPPDSDVPRARRRYSTAVLPVEDEGLPGDVPDEPSTQVSGPARKAGNLPLKTRVNRFEAALLREALEAADWDKSTAAERLGLPLRTLQHKVRALDVAGAQLPPASALEQAVGLDPGGEPHAQRVQRYEAGAIRHALERVGWATPAAARALSLPLRTLQHKLKTHGIERTG